MVGRILRNLLGNKLGYLEILRTHNSDLARVERAVKQNVCHRFSADLPRQVTITSRLELEAVGARVITHFVGSPTFELPVRGARRPRIVRAAERCYLSSGPMTMAAAILNRLRAKCSRGWDIASVRFR